MKTLLMGENFKKSSVFLILIILFLLAVSLTTLNTSSAATPLYVNGTSGNDSWDGTSPVYYNGTYGPMKTIQTAVNAVDADGTVYVAEGTYNEHVTISKNLNLIGTNRDTTIIDGTNNGRTVWIDALSNVNIANFTIRNGTITNNGGGIYSLATLTINNCIITGNTANNNRGGGIYAAGTTTVNNSIITGNTALNGGGIAYGYNTITIRYSRLTGNAATNGREIYQYYASTIDAQYNWWGQNSGPQAGQIYGTASYSPWLYMTFTASPTLILNGTTSNLTANFNNAYNGTNVTPLNPADGHLPDGNDVIFTTDFGSVGSKITTKNTSNGVAIATLTADEGKGTAHVLAQLDNQLLNSTVGIGTLYVNGAIGNDTWDGTSPIFIIGTTGPMKTIQTAINTINTGGTINVASGTYNEHLTLSKSLNLIGAGQWQTFISGTNTGRVLYINSGYNVNITNVSLINGRSTLGGTIYNQGTVQIVNSTLSNNTATSNGGAIYNDYGTVTVSGSSLTNNIATGDYGGAIYNYGGTVIVNNSKATNNAANMGGVLFNYWAGTVTVNFSTLSNNIAYSSGSVIFNNGGTVINATYNWWGQNTGPLAGQISGTVTYSPWLYMTLTANPNFILTDGTSNLTASFNNAYDGSSVTPINPANGHLPNNSPVTFTTDLGSVGSKTTVKNTTTGIATATLTADEGIGFANVSAQMDAQNTTTTIRIHDNNRYINGATGNDTWDGTSPIFISGTTGPMKTIQTAINAVETGGTINVAGGTYQEHFTISNKSLNLVGAGQSQTFIDGTNNGRILVITGSSLTINITGVTLQNGNGTGLAGGAITSSSASIMVNIYNSTLNNNTANSGSAIYSSGALQINNSFFTNNTAAYYGGAVYSASALQINNSFFTNNTAAYCGGAVYSASALQINNSTFTANKAIDGGAVYKYNPDSVNITNSIFTNNNATRNGGAINIPSGTITLNNTNLTGNTASTSGGALHSLGSVTTNNCTLINNTATDGGGAIVNGGSMNVTNSTLTNNTVTIGFGGAIYNSGAMIMHFNRVVSNSPDAIWTNTVIEAQYNWWGSNSDPFSQFSGTGTVNCSPWLYMTFTANPTLILNGSTSQLNASFNNAYNGTTITAIDPATGHLPDGSPVTFTSDLGSVGSKTTVKNTSNGVAIATLTADEGNGTAHVSAQLDNQLLNSTVGIGTLYVNGAIGNDTWDGTSPIWISGTTGPMKTITTALNAINSGGTVNVASGIYAERITIGKDLNLFGAGQDLTFIDGSHGGTVITVSSGKNVNITGVTIINGTATYGGGIYNYGTLTLNNSKVTANYASTSGGGIRNDGTINIFNCNLTGNSGLNAAVAVNVGTMTINNSNITGNSASSNMGGIYNNAGTLTITNSTITGNSASAMGGGIRNLNGVVTVNYCRILNNSPSNIDNAAGTVDARYNWWGSNSGPTGIVGSVTTSPWLYMTFAADPMFILNGSTSLLTANFNNVYNGVTVTPINPSAGHLPDGNQVTFATDLGNVGSKTTVKNTSNGVATATLTADEGIGIAHVSGKLDNQNLTSTIRIHDTNRYVNTATGNDTWDGTSPTYISGTTGPMKTIQTAINAVETGGAVNVANGIYNEHVTISKNINLVGENPETTIVDGINNGQVIVISANVNIFNFTIRNGNVTSSGGGAGILSTANLTINNCIITGNTASNMGGGILCSGPMTVINSVITGNTARYGGGIFYYEDNLTVSYSRLTGNTASDDGSEIYQLSGTVDARYNWWGQNTGPQAGQIYGAVTYSPWLYMTFTANPTLILNGLTSQLNTSFNNVYNGTTVTAIDPAAGHLPDGSPVIFTTDLGSVGSKTTVKNTINGIATATLTADEAPGTAHLSAQLDNQLLNLDVIIKPVRFVNGLTGNDTWDGSSPTWISGLIGPMKTIQVAVNAIESNGTVIVASGSYVENVVVDKLVQIMNGSGVVTVRASNAGLSVFLVNAAGSGTTIQGLNITGGSTGIYLNSANNCNLTGNNLTGNSWSGIGISGAQGTVVDGNMVSGNQEGIYILNGSTNNTIMGNTISGNQFSGVCVDTSNNTNISNNGLISGNSNGIRLYHATGNLIQGNNLANNLWCAVVLDGSSNNQIISGNTLTNNVEGIHLMNNANNNIINGTNITGNSSSWCGISVWNSTGNNLTNNTVTGKQEGIYLTQSATYNTVSQNNIHDNLNSAICLDQNSQHNIIQNNTNITLNGNGIRLYQATLNTIALNTVTHSVWAAICLDNSSNNTVSWNTVSSNQEGIYVFNNANNNVIINNTATSNAYSGICVNNAINNTLSWNNVTGNGNGIRLYNYANLNNVTHNNVTGQGWAGIVIDNSYQNQIHFNTVGGNGEGLYSMNSSSNNQIYQNNFISNTNHNAYDEGVNNYDDGVDTGNYWSDYSGSGTYAVPGGGNMDNYPSLTPF